MEKETPKILLVDDEEKITTMISDYLESLGYTTITTADGKDTLDYLLKELPACIVLDIMMPGIDGLDVTRRIRGMSTVPILLLTARAQEADKLIGLEVGADDYMVKPFSLKELAARIRALIRRSEQFGMASKAASFQYGEFTVDEEKMTITRESAPIELTAAQFKITTRLFKNPGKVYSRTQLLDAFQTSTFIGYERTIDVHIKNIRKQIEPDPARPAYILTVWGIGYKASDLKQG